MEYIKSGSRQYKANLHCHSVLSDGKLAVTELVKAYKGEGYDVLAVTDHEAPYDHSELGDENFLMITGYEAYIRPSSRCKIDFYGPEIHLNLLAKEPHNTAFVAYDPAFCKYMPPEEQQKRQKLGSLGPRSYTREYINAFIAEANRAGYLVSYNHPVWSMESEEDILSYEGFFSLEIFNTGSMAINGFENNLALYSKLCRKGKFVGVHAADDNHNVHPFKHPLCDSFGAWTMILAEKLSYDSIIEALTQGRYYASTGPEIKALSFNGKCVHLECSEAARVMMHATPKRCRSVCRSDGGGIYEADFEIEDCAPFVHFSVIAPDGTMACTRAFTREELGI